MLIRGADVCGLGATVGMEVDGLRLLSYPFAMKN